jgi:hypothetical protein
MYQKMDGQSVVCGLVYANAQSIAAINNIIWSSRRKVASSESHPHSAPDLFF